MKKEDSDETKPGEVESDDSTGKKQSSGIVDRLRERLKKKIDQLKHDDPNIYPIH